MKKLPPVAMKLKAAIQSLREEQGLSIEALEKSSGIPASRLKSFEKGNEEPLLDEIFRLARALGSDPVSFVRSVTEEPEDDVPY